MPLSNLMGIKVRGLVAIDKVVDNFNQENINNLFIHCCRTLQTDDNMIRNINALQVRKQYFSFLHLTSSFSLLSLSLSLSLSVSLSFSLSVSLSFSLSLFISDFMCLGSVNIS